MLYVFALCFIVIGIVFKITDKKGRLKCFSDYNNQPTEEGK